MIKKLLLSVFCLVGFLSGHAQNKITFNPSETKNAALNVRFKNYKILDMHDDLQRISDGETITIAMDQDYNFTLKENRFLARNVTVAIKSKTQTTRKTFAEIGFDGQYFNNQRIAADNLLAFTIFEGHYSFYIKSATKEFYIEPLAKIDPSATANQYVYYEVKDIIGTAFDCGARDDFQKIATHNPLQNRTTIGGCKTVNLDFLIDYSMYATYASLTGAINRTLEVLNLSEINYTMVNGLSDDVNFKVYEYYIVTCDSCNYWPSTLEISDNFDGFTGIGYYVFFDYPVDKIKVMYQNEGGIPNENGGIIGGLASSFTCGTSGTGFTVVKDYSQDSDLSRQILSHELGHNLGCAHTDGFIMNWQSTLPLATTWAPESIATINNTVNTFDCILDCDPLPCDGTRVAGLTVTADTDTDLMTATWISEPGMTYRIKLMNRSYDPWSEFITVSYPQNAISLPIVQKYCTDRYRFIIIPQCAGIDGISESISLDVSQGVASPTLDYWTGLTDDFWGVLFPYSPICAGKPYRCSITAIDGGTDPVFQWRVNGISVGTNSNTLLIDNLQNNDVLSCELTSNAACVASPTTVFSTVVLVTDPIPLEITNQDVGNTSICAGESVTLNQSISNNTYIFTNQFVTVEDYFNGIFMGLSNVISEPLHTRQITFTPTESGYFYSVVHLSQDTSGVTLGCYTNDQAVSIPIYFEVTPQPCNLAVADFDIAGLLYYPNPAQNVLTIEAKEIISEVDIYNVLGQTFARQNVNANRTILDLSAFATGTYFLKINAGGKIKTVKILKE